MSRMQKEACMVNFKRQASLQHLHHGQAQYPLYHSWVQDSTMVWALLFCWGRFQLTFGEYFCRWVTRSLRTWPQTFLLLAAASSSSPPLWRSAAYWYLGSTRFHDVVWSPSGTPPTSHLSLLFRTTTMHMPQTLIPEDDHHNSVPLDHHTWSRGVAKRILKKADHNMKESLLSVWIIFMAVMPIMRRTATKTDQLSHTSRCSLEARKCIDHKAATFRDGWRTGLWGNCSRAIVLVHEELDSNTPNSVSGWCKAAQCSTQPCILLLMKRDAIFLFK